MIQFTGRRKPLLIVILGPTGVGKTKLSIELAKIFQTEILSADSRQFYRELNIGTAAPSARELSEAKHHFIGHLSIQDYYNASMFEIEALELLETLFKTCGAVLLTGGSGLYIDSLCNGIDDLPKVDPMIRTHWHTLYREKGLAFIQHELLRVDPVHYKTVDLNNPKRILKALEICQITGRPYSSFLTRAKKKRYFDILKIGLRQEREILYKKINLRVERMMEEGLLKEAEGLYPFRHLNALKTVGYRELFDYLDGNISLEKAVELIKRNTRHYAKRQITWFARDKEIHWFPPHEKKQILDLIQSFPTKSLQDETNDQ
jgi:tRNA dimethylallyltransferase